MSRCVEYRVDGAIDCAAGAAKARDKTAEAETADDDDPPLPGGSRPHLLVDRARPAEFRRCFDRDRDRRGEGGARPRRRHGDPRSRRSIALDDANQRAESRVSGSSAATRSAPGTSRPSACSIRPRSSRTYPRSAFVFTPWLTPTTAVAAAEPQPRKRPAHRAGGEAPRPQRGRAIRSLSPMRRATTAPPTPLRSTR